MNELRDEVRERYAAAVKVVATGRAADDSECGHDELLRRVPPEDGIGVVLYDPATRADVPDEAVLASMGCGNPTVVAELGRRDGARPRLGRGHRRAAVREARRAHGHGLRARHDRRDARAGARERPEGQADNVEFLRGYIEDVPLPDDSVGVVISNCVINLSTDKPRGRRDVRSCSPAGAWASATSSRTTA